MWNNYRLWAPLKNTSVIGSHLIFKEQHPPRAAGDRWGSTARFNFQRPHGDGGELVVLDRKEAIDAEPEVEQWGEQFSGPSIAGKKTDWWWLEPWNFMTFHNILGIIIPIWLCVPYFQTKPYIALQCITYIYNIQYSGSTWLSLRDKWQNGPTSSKKFSRFIFIYSWDILGLSDGSFRIVSTLSCIISGGFK